MHKKELFQLYRETPKIKPSRELWVIVHPFSGIKPLHPFYFARIENLIHKKTEPIITIETEGAFKSTLEEYENLEPRGDRFFLLNPGTYAEPYCKFKKTAEICMKFEPKIVYIGGANLGIDPNGNYFQCVGTFYNGIAPILSKHGIQCEVNKHFCLRI